MISERHIFIVELIGWIRAAPSAFAAGVGGTGMGGCQAVGLHPLGTAAFGGIEMQTHKQVGLPPVGAKRSFGQFDEGVLGAGQCDFETGLLELLLELLGQEQRELFLQVLARLIPGILAAMARIETDGFTLSPGLFLGGNNSGWMTV